MAKQADNTINIAVNEQPIITEKILANFQQKLPDNIGAVVHFSGLVRGQDKQGGNVSALILSHYPAMTEKLIAKRADELMAQYAREQGAYLAVHHRVGRMVAGDIVVMVMAGSTHRRTAFQLCDAMMDYLKCDALFWKAELLANGTQKWIEPRAQDYDDAARW